MQDKELIRAGFGPRLAAFAIDRALLLLALLFVRLPAWLASLAGTGAFTAKNFLFDHSALDVLCYALSAAYFVLLTYFTGGTLGKKLLRLRVESMEGEPLRFVDVLYRETVGRFLSGILFLGYLMALADRDKRAFHDWLCHTAVVYDGGVRFAPRPARQAEAGPAAGEPAAPAASYGYSVPGLHAPTGPAPAAPAFPEYRQPGVPAPEPAPEESSAPEAGDEQ